MIVTFGCQQSIFVFPDKGSTLPMYPYKMHTNMKKAKQYMKDKRGIHKPKIIKY